MRITLGILLFLTLLITTGCSTKLTNKPNATPPSTQPSQSPSTATPQVQSANVIVPISFIWVDAKTDMLDPKGLTTDGKPDGHFHVTMAFAEAAKIKYLIMRYTEFGEHVQWAWAYNSTLPIVGSPMAVFENGALVLQGTDKGLASPGNTDLDLYIPELNNENSRDTFKFENGQMISIQIKYITKSGAEKEFNATTVVTM